MMYDLPTSLEVCGTTYEIRSDYRAVLEICAALSDPELDGEERALAALVIMYPAFYGAEEGTTMPPEHYEEAIKRCFWFISCGDESQNHKAPKLMDWEKDFKYIVAPINRVVGQEVRALSYMHWWTFISAYYEIGECTFSQIVRIREKKAKGKPLDKSDREWYAQNKEMVDFKTAYTDQDDEIMSKWMGKSRSI